MRTYWRDQLDKALPEERPTPRKMDELLGTWTYLDTLLAKKETATGKHTEVKEIATIVADSARGDDNLDTEDARIRRFRRVAAQQAITGPLTNMASLARQICNEVAYANYRDDPITANRINFYGRISQASGQGWQLLATPYALIRRSLYEHRLSEQGKLPDQVLRARLQHLDRLEARVQEMRF